MVKCKCGETRIECFSNPEKEKRCRTCVKAAKNSANKKDQTENIYLPDKTGKSRKIHSILTYQTESKRLGCINRDENSVNNMIKLVKYYFKHKSRPEIFLRETKIKQKTTTPSVKRVRKVSNVVKPVSKE